MHIAQMIPPIFIRLYSIISPVDSGISLTIPHVIPITNSEIYPISLSSYNVAIKDTAPAIIEYVINS